MVDAIKDLKSIENELKLKSNEYDICISKKIKDYLDKKISIKEFKNNVNTIYCMKEKESVNELITKHNSITSKFKNLN